LLSEDLLPIPIIDLRDGGLVRHAALSCARARAIRDHCLTFFPAAIMPLLPALDAVGRRWLQRSGSPYLMEIAEIAATLGFSGVWLLNCTYQLGCTSVVREEDGALWLARTLDWPFRGLGCLVDVVRLAAPAGEFFSVTWPGYAGVLTGMAPQRFAASINQAPMWRRTDHPWLRPYDLIANALHTLVNVRSMPPDQLLRQVFETCRTYSQAKRLLENAAVARPVIFSLIGCASGERCVIERTEHGFVSREDETSAANDWAPNRAHWEARFPASQFLTISTSEAASRCRARQDALANWRGPLSDGGFDWVSPPVLNRYTRLAATMCPAHSILRVAGYDQRDADLPERVTQECEIGTSPTLEGSPGITRSITE
jgi:hypothetical protein